MNPRHSKRVGRGGASPGDKGVGEETRPMGAERGMRAGWRA
jgi:hypothetical protein